jgi:ribosome-associated heat shock protein Hsp15
MKNQDSVRIDKFLWAVRLFKTRSTAAEACKKGRIIVDEVNAKASRMIKPGDTINIKAPPITRAYKVLDVSEKRMGAKLTPGFINEITTPDQLEILELTRLTNSQGRQRGLGRPTKKDRRDIERLFNDE